MEQEPRGSRVWRGLAVVCAVGGGCDGGYMPLAVYVGCDGCGFCVNPFGSVCVCECGIWFMCKSSRVWAYDHSSRHMFWMYVD